MTRLIAATALAALLAACTTTSGPDKPTIQTSIVPVAQPCVANTGPKPTFSDTDAAIAAAKNIFDLAKLFAAGRLQHYAYEAALEASHAGCPTPVPAAPVARPIAPKTSPTPAATTPQPDRSPPVQRFMIEGPLVLHS